MKKELDNKQNDLIENKSNSNNNNILQKNRKNKSKEDNDIKIKNEERVDYLQEENFLQNDETEDKEQIKTEIVDTYTNNEEEILSDKEKKEVTQEVPVIINKKEKQEIPFLSETNLDIELQNTLETKTKKLKNQTKSLKKEKKTITSNEKEINEIKDDVLLDVRNLQVSFKTGRKKVIRIVRGVDLKIRRGQIIGLVGESGSGKSVTSKSLLNINEFDITESDKMVLNTKDEKGTPYSIDLSSLKGKEWIKVRGKKIGYIPQDPLTSLNPTRTIKKQLLDVLKNDPRFRTTEEKIKYIVDLLESFGIRDAINKINSYPHTFSGGMKQRVVIAMVVAAQPDLIIADEPTTALDPTVQASVLTLFENIRERYNISIIFISHNISVIAKFCDYIYVMYAGKVVEKGTKIDIFTKPAHPYTWALISSIPEDKTEKLYNIPGSPPDMANLGAGDPFASRNTYAMEIDFKKEPPLFRITNTHYAATWLLDPRSPKYELSEQLQKRIHFFRKVFNIND